MPTRILREGIITSERINALSSGAELFYRRLMSVLDDYGRYFSHPALLRAACYPLQLDRVGDKHVAEWLKECCNPDPKFNLIVIYGNGKYIQCINFRQQTRSPSKFPEPTENELLIICKSNEYQMRSESESNAESKTYSAGSRVLLFYLNEKCGRHYRETAVNLGFIDARLREQGVTLEGCKLMVERQCLKWMGTEMEEYLRPATLFNKEKFDSYYAAREVPAGQSGSPVQQTMGWVPDSFAKP